MFIIIYRNGTKTGPDHCLSFYLSSQIAGAKNASNTLSGFTILFDQPIVLGGNQRYETGLDKVNTMTYSWPNVSPDYQNNIISYHNGI